MSDFKRLAERAESAAQKAAGSPEDSDAHARSLKAAKALADARQQSREDEGRTGLIVVAGNDISEE